MTMHDGAISARAAREGLRATSPALQTYRLPNHAGRAPHMSGERIVGLGEILWDLFPAGPQLGGAPFNFAFHCHQLGHPAAMVSRVGADERGRAIRTELLRRGLTDAFLQEDTAHPTGTVVVA